MKRDAIHLCCSEHAIVVFMDGSLWWRRHNWNADQWAPLALPGASRRRARGRQNADSKLAAGIKTKQRRARPRRSPSVTKPE